MTNSAFNLSSLNGSSNGFVLFGNGGSVSNAGDINGDGIDDLIIGASGANYSSGQSYVVFGNRSGFSNDIVLSNLNGNNGFVLNGVAQGDRSGYSVSGAGDINGDGIDDLIIGAPYAARDINSQSRGAGRSYVVFGNPSGFSSSIDLSSLNGTNGFAIRGRRDFVRAMFRDPSVFGEYSGRSVSNTGDINGDGIDDLVIGTDSVFFRGAAMWYLAGAVGLAVTSLSLTSMAATALRLMVLQQVIDAHSDRELVEAMGISVLRETSMAMVSMTSLLADLLPTPMATVMQGRAMWCLAVAVGLAAALTFPRSMVATALRLMALRQVTSQAFR